MKLYVSLRGGVKTCESQGSGFAFIEILLVLLALLRENGSACLHCKHESEECQGTQSDRISYAFLRSSIALHQRQCWFRFSHSGFEE